MQACIAISQNQRTEALQLRGSVVKNLSDLIEDHPGAKRLLMIHKQISNDSLSLEQQLDCKDPRFIVFPLRKVTDSQR